MGIEWHKLLLGEMENFIRLANNGFHDKAKFEGLASENKKRIIALFEEQQREIERLTDALKGSKVVVHHAKDLAMESVEKYTNQIKEENERLQKAINQAIDHFRQDADREGMAVLEGVNKHAPIEI